MGITKDQIKIVKVFDVGTDIIEVHANIEGLYGPDQYDLVYGDDQYEEVDQQKQLITEARPSFVLKPDAVPQDVVVSGAKSALTNYFPPEAYETEGERAGHRKGHYEVDGKQIENDSNDPNRQWVEDYEPREMTAEEQLDFCKSLVLAQVQVPDGPEVSEPVDLNISG